MKFLVTGAAGFIGAFTTKALLKAGHQVIGLDNLNDYYDPNLKQARLNIIQKTANQMTSCWEFIKADIANREQIFALFNQEKFDCVIHLAAQAGVRYSIENPFAYSASNLEGFLCILEACRQFKVPHLAYASSSSVYGANTKTPFCEDDPVDNPVSLYAATKRANELMAHSYAHLYGIRVTGMRFFTVYGPMGRPDMAYFKFANKMRKGETIDVYNYGNLMRDFTYIDDIVKAVVMIAESTKTKTSPAPRSPANNTAPRSPANNTTTSGENDAVGTTGARPFRIYNIGNENPEKLEYFIQTLEHCLGIKAKKNYLPMQAGDVYTTSADTSALYRDFGWKPSTPLHVGLEKFATWFKTMYDY